MTLLVKRRFVLAGLLAAPAIIRIPGLLMPVRPVRWVEQPKSFYVALHSVGSTVSFGEGDGGVYERKAVTFGPAAGGMIPFVDRLAWEVKRAGLLAWSIFDQDGNMLFQGNLDQPSRPGDVVMTTGFTIVDA